MVDKTSPLSWANLLPEISPGQFLERHWGQRPLFIKGHPGKFDPVATPASILDLLEHPPRRLFDMENHELGLNAWIKKQDGSHTSIKAHPSQASQLLEAGASLEIRLAHEMFKSLYDLATSIKVALMFSGAVDCGCFITPKSIGAKTHFDSQSVFTFQLAGTKEWRVSSRPALRGPLRGAFRNAAGGVDADQLDGDLAHEVEFVPDSDFETYPLEPGDFLFIPAGVWHDTIVKSEDLSVSVALGLINTGAWTLFADLMAQHFSKNANWRQVPIAPVSSRNDLATYVGHRIDELVSYLHTLKSSDLELLWAKRAVEEWGPHFRPRFLSSAPVTLIPEMQIRTTSRHVTLVRGTENHSRLVLQTREGRLEIDDPIEANFALKVMERQVFTVAQSREWTERAEMADALLLALIQADILEPVL
jgi:ribosomal protein L16 Arg81 hydroxylase